MQFTVATAIEHARSDQIEPWVHAYLTHGDWANPALSHGLLKQQRWWVGPVAVDVSDLMRACGPEPLMEYQVEPEHWEQRIAALMHSFTDPFAIPPLIAEYRSGTLSIRDGNHRYEAMRRKGWQTCWVIIWYDSEADFLFDRYRSSVRRIP